MTSEVGSVQVTQQLVTATVGAGRPNTSLPRSLPKSTCNGDTRTCASVGSLLSSARHISAAITPQLRRLPIHVRILLDVAVDVAVATVLAVFLQKTHHHAR